MAVRKKGLGKGIDALIPVSDTVSENKKSNIETSTKSGTSEVYVSISKVEPNREQPRKTFDEEGLNELAESIKTHGIISPLTVQDMGDYYEIIAGERRWRAARIAGLKEVPVVVKKLSDQEKAEISIIENIQREDLNPIEEAIAYKKLLTEFNLKQEELAKRVSKNRTTIANTMRLLNLSEEVQQMLISSEITSGHARALLAVEDKDEQNKIARKIISDKLSVRDVEKIVKNFDKPQKEKKVTPEVLKLLYKNFETKLRTKIGAKINIAAKDEEKGKIEIEYNSKEELEAIVESLLS